MAPDPGRWWATKVRQFVVHLVGRVQPWERASVARWLTPAELALFDSMHRADRRHGLDVVARLRADGVDDRDVLAAGLLHDSGKGRAGVAPRVVHALAEAYGDGLRGIVSWLPGMDEELERLRDHAARSAALAAAAGCPERTVELIRWQEQPRDLHYGRLLKVADDAS